MSVSIRKWIVGSVIVGVFTWVIYSKNSPNEGHPSHVGISKAHAAIHASDHASNPASGHFADATQSGKKQLPEKSAEPTKRNEQQQEQAEFKQLTDAAFESFPTLEVLSQLSADQVHHTPEVLIEAGRRLGEVAKALSENPNLKPAGIRFYQKTASAEGLPSTIRAMSYRHWKDLDTERFEGDQEDENIPSFIRKLANSL